MAPERKWHMGRVAAHLFNMFPEFSQKEIAEALKIRDSTVSMSLDKTNPARGDTRKRAQARMIARATQLYSAGTHNARQIGEVLGEEFRGGKKFSRQHIEKLLTNERHRMHWPKGFRYAPAKRARTPGKKRMAA